jgi:hypothetical protein
VRADAKCFDERSSWQGSDVERGRFGTYLCLDVCAWMQSAARDLGGYTQPVAVAVYVKSPTWSEQWLENTLPKVVLSQARCISMNHHVVGAGEATSTSIGLVHRPLARSRAKLSTYQVKWNCPIVQRAVCRVERNFAR